MLVKKRYLHPDTYLLYLMKVVNTIAEHGNAVIVGRGANLIISFEKRFSVRVIVPLSTRVKNIVGAFRCSEDEAKKRILGRDAKRAAFVNQSFHADVGDPLYYDMVLDTGMLDIESAVQAIAGAVGKAGAD